MKNWLTGANLLAVTLSFLMVFPCSIVSAAKSKATTQIKHESPKYYIPGFRIILDADIKDDVGVLVSRCYFKSKKDKHFVFMNMAPKDIPGYQIILPAPWVNSEYIEYVLVVVNKDKMVARSQLFTMVEKETEVAAWKGAEEVKELRLDEAQEILEKYEAIKKDLKKEYRNKLPEWQVADDQGKLALFTEFDRPLASLNGFYDNLAVTTVSSSSKYGVLATGLYTEEEIAAIGGKTPIAASTGATSAGTISATAGGIGWGTIAIGTAVVAAAAGAAAAGGGGGDDSTPAPASTSTLGTGGLSGVTVSQRNITLTVFDNLTVDGDQIDMTVNGISVFNNHILVGSPGTTRNVSLNSGNNTLVVTADNEGSSSPNTAALQISNVISGNSNQSWSLHTGETATMTISAP